MSGYQQELAMSLESAAGSVTVPGFDGPGADSEDIPMSSRGLGWSGLKFERRESRRGSREFSQGSRHHLIFVGLSSGEVIRESAEQRTRHELAPGCVLIIPAHTPVRWSWSSRIRYAVLLLEPAVLDRVAHEIFKLAPGDYRLPISERRNDAAIANVAGVLAREALSRDAAGNLYSESLANILSVHLLRHYAQDAHGHPLEAHASTQEHGMDTGPIVPVNNGGTPRAVAEALQYIQKNYSRDVRLSEIAAAVHVSPFHLARLFKQTLGVSPYQHVLQVRVANARHLLTAGSGPGSLAEIAAAVGFADQSHLSRHFKRITGVTPGQFRG
jgi:AraC family transcriptional regulator